jgi:hypothetical protein
MAADDRGGDCRDGDATMKRWLTLFLLLPTLACAQTANLWIDTNGGTCTRQGTPATYSDAAACSSMQAALAACTAGDTIRMKTGTYGAQTITATKTTPGCTIIAEASTTIGALETGGAWYEIQNIAHTGAGTLASPDMLWFATGTNITCRNCNFTNGQVEFVSPSNNVSWIGGSLRDMTCTGGCDHGLGIYNGANNLLVDGVTFDSIVGDGGGEQHFEVIRIDGNINGVTVRNSTFTNNVVNTATIFFSTYQGTKPINLLFENNFFSDNAQMFHFQFNFENKTNCENWTIRYNTFTGGQELILTPEFGLCSAFTNVLVVGNLMVRGNCYPEATMRYNVGYGASGSACSGTGNTVTTTAGVALGGAGGFYLQSGSTAIDAGAPPGSDCIATDHDGNSRPAGTNCDAGAHEYGAGGGSAPSAPTNFRTTLKRWIDRVVAVLFDFYRGA